MIWSQNCLFNKNEKSTARKNLNRYKTIRKKIKKKLKIKHSIVRGRYIS
jgi:hypothetical protein